MSKTDVRPLRVCGKSSWTLNWRRSHGTCANGAQVVRTNQPLGEIAEKWPLFKYGIVASRCVRSTLLAKNMNPRWGELLSFGSFRQGRAGSFQAGVGDNVCHSPEDRAGLWRQCSGILRAMKWNPRSDLMSAELF